MPIKIVIQYYRCYSIRRHCTRIRNIYFLTSPTILSVLGHCPLSNQFIRMHKFKILILFVSQASARNRWRTLAARGGGGGVASAYSEIEGALKTEIYRDFIHSIRHFFTILFSSFATVNTKVHLLDLNLMCVCEVCEALRDSMCVWCGCGYR